MRLRNIPAATEAVENSPFVLHDVSEHPVSREGGVPLHIEIGMGKGQFLLELAAENPHIRYIGIERHTSVLYRAVQKTDRPEYAGLTNLSFLCEDAARVSTMFAPGAVDLIYLNFSDPWPKKRHANRRLTSRGHLRSYRTILAADGHLEMKTDNTGLFDFTLEELTADGWRIIAATRDLHHDPVLCRGNHMTEYEAKFSGEGHAICKVIAMP